MRSPVTVRAVTVCALGLVVLWPDEVGAGNGVKPRTPVAWVDVPCMTIVDRSIDPVLSVPYGIPNEDPAEGESITPDELPDSRTHQFFALSRDYDPATFLPSWITSADVDAAAAKSIIEAGSVTPDEILETSEAWAGAWVRITADDARRSITFEMAEQGIEWDTTALAAGTYQIEGYTFEPAFNIFTRRPGVVKLVDGGPPDDHGPAVGMDVQEIILYRNGMAMVTGCVDAMEGSTLTAEWAPLDPQLGTEWTSFASEVAVDGPTFALELQAPAELAGNLGMLRVTGDDLSGRSYTTYLPSPFTVLQEDDPNACDEGGAFVGQPGCAEGSSSLSTSMDGGDTIDSGDDDSTTSSDPPGADASSSGCACGVDRGGLWTWLALLPGWLLRRRRAR